MRFPILFLTIALFHHARAAETVIAIQPLGEVKQERVDIVKKALEEEFGLKVETLDAKALPKEAWYAPRSRYRADKLLTFLDDQTEAKYRIVIGLTSKDISATKGEHEDWGIFGLGELGGRVCVVSTFRLNARGADEKKLRERFWKVAVHEVGHVMGLDHCPEKGCIMQDAEASILTVDGESGEFCGACKAALRP